MCWLEDDGVIELIRMVDPFLLGPLDNVSPCSSSVFVGEERDSNINEREWIKIFELNKKKIVQFSAQVQRHLRTYFAFDFGTKSSIDGQFLQTMVV